LAPNGTIERCAIALFGLGSVPVRASAAEAAVTGQSIDAVSPDEIGRLAVGDVSDPGEDLHAPLGYRTRVGAAMAAKAWNQALEEAGRA
jgi:carbon-monoxide dehydrogenase medium subunit